jgi:hypothetical protein
VLICLYYRWTHRQRQPSLVTWLLCTA